MEENVIKELDNLKGMMLNWKKSFLGWASPEGDNDYVHQDFSEDIQKMVYHYVRRLYETKHLSDSEAKEFMDYCYSQVEDLRDQLRDVESKQSKKEV
jgi:hypothetical protein